jgi:hypothetical protein
VAFSVSAHFTFAETASKEFLPRDANGYSNAGASAVEAVKADLLVLTRRLPA